MLWTRIAKVKYSVIDIIVVEYFGSFSHLILYKIKLVPKILRFILPDMLKFSIPLVCLFWKGVKVGKFPLIQDII